MTNRENINNQNIADLLLMINTNIPYKCVIECIDPCFSAANCNKEPQCIHCINKWLNSEVKQNND